MPDVRRLLEIALPLPPRSARLRLAWSDWRPHKRWQARRGDDRRRLHTLGLDTDSNDTS